MKLERPVYTRNQKPWAARLDAVIIARAHFKTTDWEGEAPAAPPRLAEIPARQEPRPPGIEEPAGRPNAPPCFRMEGCPTKKDLTGDSASSTSSRYPGPGRYPETNSNFADGAWQVACGQRQVDARQPVAWRSPPMNDAKALNTSLDFPHEIVVGASDFGFRTRLVAIINVARLDGRTGPLYHFDSSRNDDLAVAPPSSWPADWGGGDAGVINADEGLGR